MTRQAERGNGAIHLLKELPCRSHFLCTLDCNSKLFALDQRPWLVAAIAGLLISRQIIGNLRESFWPGLVEQWRLARLSFNMYGALSPTQVKTPIAGREEQVRWECLLRTLKQSVKVDTENEKDKETPPPTQGESATTTATPSSSPKRVIGQAEIESALFKYDGTFSDHLEMLVQMGHGSSRRLPLAGLCALANNILEIRSMPLNWLTCTSGRSDSAWRISELGRTH